MNEFKRLLRPLRIKLFLESYINRFFLVGSIFILISIIFEIISKFVTMPYKNIIYNSFLILSFAVPFFIVIFRDRIDYFKTARKCDFLGYNERFITSYEILCKDSNISDIESKVVSDTLAIAKSEDISKKYRITLPKKLILIFTVILICFFTVGFVKPYGKEDFEILINNQLGAIDEEISKAEKNELISKEELKAVKEQIKDLKKELKNSVKKEQGLESLEKAEQELKKLEKESYDSNAKKISDTLSKNSNTKRLADTIKNGDSSNIEREISNLIEDTKGMSDGEKDEILSDLENLKDEVSSDEIKDVLEELSNAVSSSSISDSSLKKISGSISKASSKGNSIRKAIKDINNDISKAKNQLSDKNNENTSNNSGNGQDNNGKGSGNGGQNVGSSSGSGTSGNGRGQGEGNHEEIYTRDAINKNDTDIDIEGQENSGGDISATNESTIGNAGESKPYSEVYNEYRQEAMQSMDRNNIPYGMRDLVTDYFSKLEE